MSPDKQRIAIAEACGWKRKVVENPANWMALQPENVVLWLPPTKENEPQNYGYHVPDYLTDLNVMHEAEMMLTDEQFDERYVVELGRMFYPKNNGPWKWKECPTMVVRATAAQRAEAFLRTLGKWEE